MIQKVKKIPGNEETTNISAVDIQNVQNFLIEEYGVTKECLEIK